MISECYITAGVLMAVTGYLFSQEFLSALMQTIAWTVIFFAPAAASAAYLTATEARLKIGPPGPTVVAGSGGPCRMRRAVATTTRRSALGEVSDAIVRTAYCPVLVVRGGGALGETGTRPDEDAR